MRVVPAWAALLLAGAGGAISALQSAVNAELAQRIDSAILAAVLNIATGAVIVVLAVPFMPSARAGLRRLPGSRLPWWAYLGGLGGAFFVTSAAYAVPTLGVAVFTIAQVAGGGVGGLLIDRAGLAPIGRLPMTGPRLAGAALGLGAVVLAQLGRPAGEVVLGLLGIAVAGGIAVAFQTALNGRVSAVSTTAAGTAVNFAVNTPLMLLLAGAVVAFGRGWPDHWPPEWYLYVGGVFSVVIVTILVVSVHAVGVLRTGLATVAGQLTGAVLIDVAVPGGPGLSVALLAGALLTMVAVVVAGRGLPRRSPVDRGLPLPPQR
ncbi:MAG TPA: DMT family transporter [Pilimelia sp.]|nr:DMT family transporter [Pilimelia sp.]